MCPFVWQQDFLQLLEEQLESISKASLCLFSKFAAVALSPVKEDFGPARSAFVQRLNGHREQAVATNLWLGASQSSVGGVLRGESGSSVAGRRARVNGGFRGPGRSSRQCSSRGTSTPFSSFPTAEQSCEAEAVSSSEVSWNEEQPWPCSCGKTEGEGWREQKNPWSISILIKLPSLSDTLI